MNRRVPLGMFAMILGCLAVLSITGCTGLTSAGSTAANTKTNSNSSGTLAASPTSLNFGNVEVGFSSSPQTVTLTNTGTGPVAISQGNFTGTGFGVVGGMASASIAAGQSSSYQVQFAPTAVGPASGTMSIVSNATNSPLTISVSGTGMPTVSINTQPVNQSVVVGQTATFSVAATGAGTLTYQWKKGGTAISGATAASYTTPATTNADNGSIFTVVVTDTNGSLTSNPATLTVTATAVAPSITAQPANQTVTTGQTATFSVTATGTSPLSYQWLKNGAAISGATSATYTTPATAASDNNAQFTVTVTNSVSSVTSSAATLTVNIPPTISAQPASQTVTVGQTATFSVTASGSGTLTYQWKKNGTAISGATSASYTTPATVASDNGSSFTVTVTSSTGSVTSNAATLTVNAPPSITTQPASTTVNVGQTASFSVAATGTGTLTYQWKKNGAAISGATSASYTTPATASTDNGAQFTVTVTNSFGNMTSNAATLTVNVPPTISAQPASQTVTVGQAATFSVTASGSGTLTYQWKKNGTAISGATSASYTTPATVASDNGSSFTVTITSSTGNATSNAATLTVNAPPSITTQPASTTVNVGQTASFSVAATGTGTLTYQWSRNSAAISGATSASYTTPATASTDNGALFTVTVTNSFGNMTSNAATLTVNVPPTISTQPVSQTVAVGQTATFSVTASGSGTLTYQWKKNGTVVSGATSASYTTPATVASDNGSSFTVTVTSSTGNVTSNAATLTVNTPPSITTQPGSATVIAGQTATFSVAATGTAPLTYQWKMNGTAIGGATSTSYTTPVTTTGNSGEQFTVTVTNAAGNTTSNAATLTVNAATFVLNASTALLTFPSVNIGSNSLLPIVYTNAGNSSVTISNVSISGAGYTATGVSAGQILTSGQTATLNVTFAPSAAGTIPGSVTVTSNATNSPASTTLTGTGVQPVSHSVTLTWTASASMGVTGYNVYRSTVSGGPYTKLTSPPVAATTYVDSAVQSAQTYYYVVTSVDSSGVESADSAEVSATVP
jgi:Immunoglobulin domain/Immunoglobulin I-set domain/Abnormal spindle-like microcephaly-assoc'd, ASPM-SPD-2-Hydin